MDVIRKPFAAMRREYIEGIRAKGFAFTTVTGTAEKQLSLSGLGKQLLGINFFAAGAIADDVTLTLKVNNDVVLEKVNANAIANNTTNPRQYYDLGRPLTGQDTILLEFTDGVGAQPFNIVLYYTQGNS